MKIAFIASVKENYIERVDEVAALLRKEGCEITRVMHITGVIAGKVDTETDLRKLFVEGIDSVEKEKVIKKRKTK